MPDTYKMNLEAAQHDCMMYAIRAPWLDKPRYVLSNNDGSGRTMFLSDPYSDCPAAVGIFVYERGRFVKHRTRPEKMWPRTGLMTVADELAKLKGGKQ